MLGIGPLELVLVLVILLMLFGARRLPEMGRQLGSGMREFKEGIVNPVDEVKESVKPTADEVRTMAALPSGARAESGAAPKVRDAVPD